MKLYTHILCACHHKIWAWNIAQTTEVNPIAQTTEVNPIGKLVKYEWLLITWKTNCYRQIEYIEILFLALLFHFEVS